MAAADTTMPVQERDLRAATEYLFVDPVPRTPGFYHVYSETGRQHVVDVETESCTCPDMQYRNPDAGCKHLRRVAMETGERAVPACLPERALDPFLVDATEVSGDA